MFEDLTKLNISTCSDVELITRFCQVFPIVAEVYMKILYSETNVMPGMHPKSRM